MDAKITYTPDWSSLPEHLLASIAKRLHTRFDILRFRAVCRLFRSILPLPPKVLFMFNAHFFFSGSIPYDDVPYFLSEWTVYAIQPLNNETSQTWLVKIKESETGRVQLKDLVCISPFNPFKNLSKNFPRSFNLVDYRVTEITKYHTLESFAPFKGKAKYAYPPRQFFSAKVVCTSSLDESDDGFAVMIHFKSFIKPTVWRNIDKKWTDIDWDIEIPDGIVDIIYHNDKFYVLISSGFIIDVDYLSQRQVADPPEFLYFWSLYLVESIKDLILIARDKDRNNEEDHYIKVFKLDEEKHKWVRVVDRSELEDRVIFLSGRSSCSVSAKEFSGWKGNCVYFKGDGKKHDDPGYDAWIYDLKDNEAQKLPDFPCFETTLLKQGSCSAGCQ